MKALFILSTLIAVSTAQEWVAGSNVRGGRAVTETAVDPAAKCATAANNAAFCSSTPGCAKGLTYFKCYNQVALAPKACVDPTPYCSGGICVPDAPSGCAADAACPGAGYFPVAGNCYAYSYCYFDPAAADFVGVQKVCPTGYPFNPSGPQDRKCLKGGACLQPTCTAGKTSEWRGYAFYNFTANQIALYCVGGKAIRIDSCDAGLAIDLTVTNTKVCALKCLRDYQKAVYPQDNKKYQLCLGGRAYLENCEFGQVFDGESLNCITAPSTAAPATTVAATTTAAGAATTTTAAGGATTTTAAGTDSTTTPLATTTTV